MGLRLRFPPGYASAVLSLVDRTSLVGRVYASIRKRILVMYTIVIFVF